MHNTQKSEKYTILLEFIGVLVYSIQAHIGFGVTMPKISQTPLFQPDYVELKAEVRLDCIPDLYLIVL